MAVVKCAPKSFYVLLHMPVLRPEIDEHDLILAMVNDLRQRLNEQDALRRREVATEDGVLQGVAEAAHSAVDAAQATRICNVIADNVAVTHLAFTSCRKAGRLRPRPTGSGPAGAPAPRR